MNPSFKESQERLNLEIFRSAYKNFPDGRIKKSESPDFILERNKKEKTGIELSSIPPVKDFDSLIKKINICLNKKNEKLNLYKKKGLDEYWLIISIDFLGISGSFQIQEKLSFHIHSHGFSKLFLLDLFNSNVYDLSQI